MAVAVAGKRAVGRASVGGGLPALAVALRPPVVAGYAAYGGDGQPPEGVGRPTVAAPSTRGIGDVVTDARP